MDRRKTFFLLATIGAVLVTAPFLYHHYYNPDDATGSNTVEYFPVQDPTTGKWGFIDNQGEPVTPMVFDWAGDYRQGLGLVESNSAMGYIDQSFKESGKWAIHPRFELRDAGDQPAHGFFDGRALARDHNGLWGYLDREGKWAIEPRFAEARDYPGLPAGDFSDGLAWFQVVEMSERNVLNEDDEFVRDSEGKPLKQAYPRRRVGYIDRSGRVVIEPRYEMANDFGEGLAAVRIKSHDSWGFIDKDKTQVISPRFDEVGRFSDGLCAVCLHGRWGYIDPKGKDVIERRYDEARAFSEGLAAVREGALWGYIDAQGDWVIPPAFDDFEAYGHPGDPSPFENGLARVTLDGQSIYINRQGDRVWPKD